MYDDVCPHGYVAGSCSECRAVAAEVDEVGALFQQNMARHKGGNRAGWLTRRSEITGRLAELEGYARRSNAQDEELHRLTSELTVLGSLIDQDDVRVRAEKVEAVKRARLDPANVEAGWDPGPALGKLRLSSRAWGTGRRRLPRPSSGCSRTRGGTTTADH